MDLSNFIQNDNDMAKQKAVEILKKFRIDPALFKGIGNNNQEIYLKEQVNCPHLPQYVTAFVALNKGKPSTVLEFDQPFYNAATFVINA